MKSWDIEKNNTCCSEECKNEKKKRNASKFYEAHKKEINEKYKKYRQNYRLAHKEEIKKYQKNYRKNGGVSNERSNRNGKKTTCTLHRS